MEYSEIKRMQFCYIKSRLILLSVCFCRCCQGPSRPLGPALDCNPKIKRERKPSQKLKTFLMSVITLVLLLFLRYESGFNGYIFSINNDSTLPLSLLKVRWTCTKNIGLVVSVRPTCFPSTVVDLKSGDAASFPITRQ